MAEMSLHRLLLDRRPLGWWYRRGQRFGVEFAPSNMNGPHIASYWWWDCDQDAPPSHAELSLSWGNGNSDPVWSVWARVPVPPVLARWLARRFR